MTEREAFLRRRISEIVHWHQDAARDECKPYVNELVELLTARPKPRLVDIAQNGANLDQLKTRTLDHG